MNFNGNSKYVTEIKRKKTYWASVVYDGAERYLGWKSAINDFTSRPFSFHILYSTPFVHPVLKQVLPKAEIRRIRVWRKFQMKVSSSQWEDENCPPKKGKKQLRADWRRDPQTQLCLHDATKGSKEPNILRRENKRTGLTWTLILSRNSTLDQRATVKV